LGTDTLKQCTVCKVHKDLSQYYKSKREKDGYGYRCKTCDNLVRKISRNRNNKVNPTKDGFRNRYVLNKYGINQKQYLTMLETQGGLCAICKTNNPLGRDVVNSKDISFCVDHCHKTLKVRGLLCNLCNRALGLLKDDPETLKNALNYLKIHS